VIYRRYASLYFIIGINIEEDIVSEKCLTNCVERAISVGVYPQHGGDS
jgi:hypothetical protein